MIRSVVLAVLAAVVVTTTAGGARADGELGLSWDGRTWKSDLQGSLFDPAIRWVPGDRRTSDFFIRNQATDGAELTIAVESADRDDLLRHDDIALTARVDDGAWVDLERVDQGYRLTERPVRASEVARVQVRAAFDPASTNQSQRDDLRMRFQVTLSDARAGDGNDDGDDGLDGFLPDTGAPAIGWLLALAGALIGTGLALVRRQRREVRRG